MTLSASKDNTLLESSTGSLSNALGQIFVGRTNQAAGSAIRLCADGVRLLEHPGGRDDHLGGAVADRREHPRCGGVDIVVPAHPGLGRGDVVGIGQRRACHDGRRDVAQHVLQHQHLELPRRGLRRHAVGHHGGVGLQRADLVIAQMASDIQGWKSNPSSNFGWILIGNETTPLTAYEFNSRESGATGPSLSVTYEAVVPEPGCSPWPPSRRRSWPAAGGGSSAPHLLLNRCATAARAGSMMRLFKEASCASCRPPPLPSLLPPSRRFSLPVPPPPRSRPSRSTRSTRA